MRINKFLAECGVASRRNSEILITEGKVKVNGHVVTKLATDIDPVKDIVVVCGNKVQPIEQHVYIMLNKPKGYVCTTSDEKGRKTVMELLKGEFREKRIFPIGRLDYDTEGLLLLTTDGDLSNVLTHPKHEVTKTYHAKVEGEIPEGDLAKLRGGVVLDGKKTNKSKITLKAVEGNVYKYEVVISEGRNRQVRRMFECVNKEVVFLKRVAIGTMKLGGLYRGEYRELKAEEVEYLKNI